MNLLQRLRQPVTEERYSLEDYAADVATFFYSGNVYGGTGLQTTYDKRPAEKPAAGFAGRVRGAYQGNGVVFACMLARLLLFAEARFMWQQLRAGRPGDRFWTRDLLLLERPWFNGSTGELLARMIQDADLAGNSFIRRTGPLAEPALERLRPDWTTILLGTNSDLLNAEVVGYGYLPEGDSSERAIFLDRSEVAHWSPIPDPLAHYRGMSWLTPILREVRGDSLAIDHKNQFWENSATPNMKITFGDAVKTPEQAEKWKTMFEGEHRGVLNAWKRLFLAGGMDAEVIGVNFKEMDYKAVQAAGETRIAAAAGVPPVIVGLSEGLEAATYSNYAQARRRFADMTIRPLWRSACASLQNVIPAPERSRLWYDDRDIPALQEDAKDSAEIEKVKAETIVALVRDGFEPESAVNAVLAEDLSLLTHTGKTSVQLKDPDAPAGNGAVPASAA